VKSFSLASIGKRASTDVTETERRDEMKEIRVAGMDLPYAHVWLVPRALYVEQLQQSKRRLRLQGKGDRIRITSKPSPR